MHQVLPHVAPLLLFLQKQTSDISMLVKVKLILGQQVNRKVKVNKST